ncbi:transcription initiation factor TFIID subunit 3 isoform X1 [Hydra vulgaris]|uniref:Transcription initiation factor TFIID subunit 3 n=1 Tax=Hydra vulgaris TaxID=6087 RepID=T2MCC5_HYDVU|nr:transcription initiation factor TFIID subunit 3 [Hydra vulgaris]
MIKKKETFSRASLSLATAQICHSLGWHSIHQSSHDVLTDVLERYLLFLTQTAVKYCQNYCRTVPNLDDVSLTFEQLGVHIHELEDYVQQVESSPVLRPPPKFPYCLSNNQLQFIEDEQYPPKVEVLPTSQIKEEYPEDNKQDVSIKVEEIELQPRPEDLFLPNIICSSTSPATSPSEKIIHNTEKNDFTRPGLIVTTPKGFTPNLKSPTTIDGFTDNDEAQEIFIKEEKPPLPSQILPKITANNSVASKSSMNTNTKYLTVAAKIDLDKTNFNPVVSLSSINDQLPARDKSAVKKEGKPPKLTLSTLQKSSPSSVIKSSPSSLLKSFPSSLPNSPSCIFSSVATNSPKSPSSLSMSPSNLTKSLSSVPKSPSSIPKLLPSSFSKPIPSNLPKSINKKFNKNLSKNKVVKKSEVKEKKNVSNEVTIKHVKKDTEPYKMTDNQSRKMILTPQQELVSPTTPSKAEDEVISPVTPLKKMFQEDVLPKCTSHSEKQVEPVVADLVVSPIISPQKTFVSSSDTLLPYLGTRLTESPLKQITNVTEVTHFLPSDIPTDMPVLTYEKHIDDVLNLTEGSTENEVDILSLSKDELSPDELQPMTHSSVIFTCGDEKKKKKKKKKSLKSEHRREKKRKHDDKKETFIPIPKLTLKMAPEMISESTPSKLVIKSEVVSPVVLVPPAKKTKKQKETKPAAGFYAETITNTSSSMSADLYYCPGCDRPDDGSPMIGCDSCDGWYHWSCVNITVAPADDAQWFCSKCAPALKKSTPAVKKKKKKKKKEN